jgi:hypothetical protein
MFKLRETILFEYKKYFKIITRKAAEERSKNMCFFFSNKTAYLMYKRKDEEYEENYGPYFASFL